MPERKEITIPIDCTRLDEAIEKTDKLVELLREANDLICALSCTMIKQTDR